MGYNLTFHSELPHGRACAVFIGKYVEYQSKCEEGIKLLSDFAAYLGTSPDEIARRLPALAEFTAEIDEETLTMFADKVKTAGNFANAPYKVSYDEMMEIYKDLFVK